MKNSVVIKGNKYGIVVILDSVLPFEQLIKDVESKFKESSKFFGKASMVITFEGRNLNDSEEHTILDIITENTDISVACVADNDSKREAYFKKTLDEKLADMNTHTGQFYKGTLRSGQVLESVSSLIILGDVNPGAKIISAGNVIVLGTLKGTVYAGASGDSNSFVLALDMKPVQIRIGDIIARCPDEKKKKDFGETRIAFVEDNNIYIEPLSKEVLNDIRFY